MRGKIAIMMLTAAVLFYGCAVTEEVNKETYKSETMLAERIGKGNLHGAGKEGIDEGLLIIRNDEKWSSLKSKMDKSNPVSHNLKQVNFSEQMVLAYFDPVRPNGAYSVQIIDVVEHESTIEVIVHLKKSELPATSVMIQPYHIVAVPISPKSVRLTTKEVIE